MDARPNLQAATRVFTGEIGEPNLNHGTYTGTRTKNIKSPMSAGSTFPWLIFKIEI